MMTASKSPSRRIVIEFIFLVVVTPLTISASASDQLFDMDAIRNASTLAI
ncbi:hypothetical protein CA13_38200 [Planctomycetes bacterium CA13]|uniref:Uncharacterized protein n=1 Tax=Novipirellula herctigrandis TaxID=2527986 RepID=A0A5C5Z4V4_9BACT|nr:hypothetical protein CA13_38200 [Planctomycetes bacterium CA13]